jgi:hypothetical protein
VRLEGLGKLKKFNDLIRTQTKKFRMMDNVQKVSNCIASQHCFVVFVSNGVKRTTEMSGLVLLSLVYPVVV